METSELIKILDDVNGKISNRVEVVEHVVGGYPPIPIRTEKYSVDQLINLWDRKASVIDALYKSGNVSEEEYKRYLLSETADFTPKLTFTK